LGGVEDVTPSNDLGGVGNEVVSVIDEAWVLTGPPVSSQDPGTFVVNLAPRIIGTNGETSIRIVKVPGTSKIITA
jgi:filamentous hemagglutinin